MSDPERTSKLSPLDAALAILGEHYENYVVIVNNHVYECEYEFNNLFAAKGLLDTAKKAIDSLELSDDIDDDVEIVWDDDEDEDFGV